MCAWTGGILGRGSKSEAWVGHCWKVVRHGCGELAFGGRKFDRAWRTQGSSSENDAMDKDSSSSRLNGQPTFNTAIDVPPALLLAIIRTAEPVLAVTTRHHASQIENTKPSVLLSSSKGNNI